MACPDANLFGVEPHHYSCCISPGLCCYSSFAGSDYPSAHPQVGDNMVHNLTGYFPDPTVPEEVFISSDGIVYLASENPGYPFALQTDYPNELPSLPSSFPNNTCQLSGTGVPRPTPLAVSHLQPVTGAVGSTQPQPDLLGTSHPNIHVPGPAGCSQDQVTTDSDCPAPTSHRFIYESFPNGDQEGKRDALRSVMTAHWKLENHFEPHSDVLLSFMDYNSVRRRWHCSFSKAGRVCNKSFKKKDQAKGHIRCHIGLKPYACQSLGPCWMSESSGAPCRKRYVAAEPLQKHRSRRVICERCGTSMLKGNVLRHQETACRGASSQESPGSSSCVSTPR
ncbi:hypothetical protein CPB86DRAFT_811207 [Serendipita vermifera]|nr:hypothetical protein CPB86DRAFT_811207 [Serendipita vermifera]